MLNCTACGGLTPRETAATCLHCDEPLRAPRWAWKLTRLLGPAGAILLAACYGAPGRYYGRGDSAPIAIDGDRDGSPSRYECNPHGYRNCDRSLYPHELDCDDADPSRYPGAQDFDGDGIDQNCDGVDGWRDPATVARPATVATDPTTPAPAPTPIAPTPIAIDPPAGATP